MLEEAGGLSLDGWRPGWARGGLWYLCGTRVSAGHQPRTGGTGPTCPQHSLKPPAQGPAGEPCHPQSTSN